MKRREESKGKVGEEKENGRETEKEREKEGNGNNQILKNISFHLVETLKIK